MTLFFTSEWAATGRFRSCHVLWVKMLSDSAHLGIGEEEGGDEGRRHKRTYEKHNSMLFLRPLSAEGAKTKRLSSVSSWSFAVVCVNSTKPLFLLLFFTVLLPLTVRFHVMSFAEMTGSCRMCFCVVLTSIIQTGPWINHESFGVYAETV